MHPAAGPPAAHRDGLVDDLLAFLDGSPSPVHATLSLATRLDQADFRRLSERESWQLNAGDTAYAVRDDSSLVAFRLGTADPVDAGFRLVGAHTDSPTFRVRPHSELHQGGYTLVGVEPYGGALAHTWLDRELTVAGRVALAGGRTAAVVLPGSPVRLPSLAIHLDRSVREGFVLDPQRDLVPVWSAEGATDGLLDRLAAAAGVTAADVLSHDVVLADTQAAALTGADGTWIASPRLDDLAGCHAGLHALLAASGSPMTQVLVCNDHEEIGSGSAEGARGSFLGDVLGRLVEAGHGEDRGRGDALARALAGSRLVSVDMAHAVHPTRFDRHEPSHRPVLGGGPVLKSNAGQAYATDAAGAAWFIERCRSVGVTPQHFVSRADLPCGSTIGPLTATRLGIPTVDVGNPMLGMHSCRELASTLDVAPMVDALTSCLEER